MSKRSKSSLILMLFTLVISTLVVYNPSSVEAGVIIGPVTVTIIQPANGGYTKMATPLIVTTNAPSTCQYLVGSDFEYVNPAVDLRPNIMSKNASGTIHTANIKGLEPGTYTVYVRCMPNVVNGVTDGSANSTWTKLGKGNTKLLGVHGAEVYPGILWEIDSESGELTNEIGPVVVDGYGVNVTAIAQQPGSNTLYGTTGYGENPYNKSLITINPTTGAATLIGELCVIGDFRTTVTEDSCQTVYIDDISFDTNGQLYGWSSNFSSLFTINLSNGEASMVPQPEMSINPPTIGAGNGFGPDGQLYILQDPYTLATITKSTGLIEGDSWDLDIIPMNLFDFSYGAADFDNTGMMFAQAYQSGGVGLVSMSINGLPSYGTLSVIEKIPGTTTAAVIDLAYDPNAVVFNLIPDGIGATMSLVSALSFYTPISTGSGTTVPSCGLTINDDASQTTSLDVTLKLSSTSGGAEMMIANDSNMTEAGWETYAETKTWQLPATDYGQKTVYARIKDIRGQISSCSDSIQYVASGLPTAPGEQGTASLPEGVDIGELVKRADIDTVYFIDEDNKRHVFPNLDTFLSWFPDFSEVKVISAETLAAIPMGSNVTMRPGTWLVKIQSEPSVYAIEPNGRLKKLANESIAQTLYGVDWNTKIKDVDPTFFTDYTLGSEIDSAVYPDGSVIQYAGDTSIYYIESNLKRPVSSQVFTDNKLQEMFVNKNVDTAITYTLGSDWTTLPMETLMML